MDTAPAPQKNEILSFYKEQRSLLFRNGLLTDSGIKIPGKFFRQFFDTISPKQAYYLAVYLRSKSIAERNKCIHVDPFFTTTLANSSNVLGRNLEKNLNIVLEDLPDNFITFIFEPKNTKRRLDVSAELFKIQNRERLILFLVYLCENCMS
jgi:hypothetical protein